MGAQVSGRVVTVLRFDLLTHGDARVSSVSSLMPHQAPTAYAAEVGTVVRTCSNLRPFITRTHLRWLPQKHGDLAHIKTMFAAQMHYLEAYHSVIPALSKDDG